MSTQTKTTPTTTPTAAAAPAAAAQAAPAPAEGKKKSKYETVSVTVEKGPNGLRTWKEIPFPKAAKAEKSKKRPGLKSAVKLALEAGENPAIYNDKDITTILASGVSFRLTTAVTQKVVVVEKK